MFHFIVIQNCIARALWAEGNAVVVPSCLFFYTTSDDTTMPFPAHGSSPAYIAPVHLHASFILASCQRKRRHSQRHDPHAPSCFSSNSILDRQHQCRYRKHSSKLKENLPLIYTSAVPSNCLIQHVSIPNSAHQFFAGGRLASPHFCNSCSRFSAVSPSLASSQEDQLCHISKSTRPLESKSTRHLVSN